MDIRNLRRLFPTSPVLLVAAAGALLILACGGTAIQRGGAGDGGGGNGDDSAIDSATCAVIPCPSESYWDPVTCSCAPAPVGQCTLACPSGEYSTLINGYCVCQPYNNGEEVPDGDVTDSTAVDQEAPDGTEVPDEGPADSMPVDSPWYYDSIQPSYDAPYYTDATPYCGNYNYYCGPGYTWEPLNGYCQCVACNMVCPNGETPGNSCLSCVACTSACPAGFYVGQNCNCIPDGVDSGPPPVYEAGPPVLDGGNTPGCTLEGYRTCALGSWCELGVCPDNKTQYGCYCDTSGKATCNLACPQPPVCNIPGLGTCAPGQTCIYGESSCQGDSGSVLECNCYNGNASCYSLSCASYESYYGPDSGFDSGPGDTDGGPSCYLQGYTQCPVGQYCQLGTCPGGTSYGCTCNSDGTTTCNLQCPPPPPCNVPGEGTCPYGQTCTYGTCTSSSATLLNCSCQYSGQVSCYTTSCNGGGPDGGIAVDGG